MRPCEYHRCQLKTTNLTSDAGGGTVAGEQGGRDCLDDCVLYGDSWWFDVRAYCWNY